MTSTYLALYLLHAGLLIFFIPYMDILIMYMDVQSSEWYVEYR